MPVPGPSVLPQYYGGNPGQLIAQAYLQKQAFDRQRDLDAVETGVGLQRGDVVSTDAPLSFGDRIRQAVQRVTGQGQQATPAQIAATRQGLNTLATQQAAANNASLGANTTSPVAAGSYTPQGIPQTLRLPSGQTVETMFTPFGQRLQQAALQRQFNMAMLGMKGEQAMDQIAARGTNQANTANIRGGYQLETTDRRNAQSDVNNQRTVAASIGNNIRTTDTQRWTHVTPGAESYSPVPIVDPATGQMKVGRFGKTTGTIEDTGMFGKPNTTGQSAQNSVMNARLGVAAQQAQAAHETMTQFENDVLSGKRQISAASMAAAKAALQGGAITGTLSESALNSMDPDVAQYVRAAHQLATAERLITPRGGSNALMNAEAMLSKAGPGANAALIRQARGYREALISGLASHGGSAPQTTVSGPAPWASRTQGEGNVGVTSSGQPLHGTGATTLPPLTAEQRTRAASDPDYAAFLSSKGYPF